MDLDPGYGIVASPLSITRHGDRLVVRMPPYGGVGDYKTLLDQVAKACERHGCYRLLVDMMGIAEPIPIVDLYELGSYVKELVRIRPFRIAVLSREEALHPDRFFENVAVNLGIQLKVFTGQEEALDWLG